jgi:PAS domain S-box-containing protein
MQEEYSHVGGGVTENNSDHFESEKSFLNEYELLSEDIRNSNELLNLLLDQNPDPWYLYDLKGFLVDCNQSFEELVGYNRADLIGKCFLHLKLLPLIQRARAKIILDKNAAGMVSGPDGFEFITKDGELINVELKNSLINIKNQKLVLVTVRDVENHLKKEKALESRTEAREKMIEELYRQIEKNLQIVTSLMNLQKAHMQNDKDAELLQDTHNRVKSIRKAYEKLIQSPELSRINFAEYSKSILSGLLSTYAPEPGNIALNVELEDTFMDMGTSIPLGMILTELVSNSFRHAFKQDIMGEIRIIFKNYPDYYVLRVQDNGEGFPEDVNFDRTHSLGLQLVKSLVNQIDGNMKRKLSGGTCFSIEVPKLGSLDLERIND